jgi:glycosyltransferase involved in cell wall biosynthesis
MKALFLASDPALGPDVPFGDSIRVRLILDALADAGVDVDVRWAGPAGAPGAVLPPVQRSLPTPVLQTVRDARSLLRAVDFRRRLTDLGSPDVVFEFASYLAPVGVSVARRLRVPYVVEVEGPLASLRYEDGNGPVRVLGDLLERRRVRAADTVVTVSEPLARWLRDHGATRTAVVPNVADDTLFAPDADRRKRQRELLGLADRFVVGFHGVLSPWYGLDALVAAVALATESAPQISLLIVGDGVERTRVEALIHSHGLDDRAIVTGFVPHVDAPGYVDAFDVGVIADHVWWTSPLKLFEYGAMRKPVVAAAAASIADTASDDSVLLVPARDVEALSAALVRLSGDSAERERLADAWHARVAADFVREKLSEQLRSVLDDAVRR